MNIVVLVEDFPDLKRSVFPFVKQLVDEMANQGHELQVIAPFSITKNRRLCKRKEYYRAGKGTVTIYRPLYVSFSTFRIGSQSLSYMMLQKAINRALKKLEIKPDAIYGHFWHTAFCGYKYALQNNLPLFVASGESEIAFRADTIQKRNFCNYLSGVVCVSTKNKEESEFLGLTQEDKCVVFPNAIDKNLFKNMDKEKCRSRLNLPKNAFIVIFVGWFIKRKGPLRVAEAISKIQDGKPVYSLFIGSGNDDPTCDNILFKGIVKHSDIPIYLNAVDVFVLPTLHEGCCNAIVEAMACGLPVISSDLPFNKDICNEKNSILVDPMNIDAIRDAIISLRNDINLRASLSNGALNTSKELTIDKRASRIIDFMIKRKNS